MKLAAAVLLPLVLAAATAAGMPPILPAQTAQTEREKELEERIKALEKKIEGEGGTKDLSSPDGLTAALPGAEVRFESLAAVGMYNNAPSIVIWEFAEDGVLKGRTLNSAGNATDTIGAKAQQDVGRWRVAGRQVCVKWRKWSGGDERCYDFLDSGTNRYLVGHGAKYRVTGL